MTKAGAMWSAGNYAAAGDRWAQASVDLAAETASAGRRFLDIACGPGTLAIAAARIGAEVTGLDAAPALLALARGRAEDAGVPVTWVEADMTRIPSPDASFDTVASAFGCMFAPDAAAMAAEMVRVLRPGGTATALAWTPESAFGRTSPMVVPYLPPGAGESPAERWASPEKVAEVYADLPVDVTCAERTVEVVWDDLDQAVHEIIDLNPVWLSIRAGVEPTGRFPELVGELRELLASHGRDEDGRFVLPLPYLQSTATLRE